MGSIAPFLKAIPAAATNPYSLVAYAICAVLFIISAVQRTHLKTLLTRIEAVPESERRAAIEVALNTKLPSSLSANQYLRIQKQRYIFSGSMALLVLIATVTVVALVLRARQSPPTAGSKPDVGRKIMPLRVQLWPRPPIKRKFLAMHDARLYLKVEGSQIDVTDFVPALDFLDATKTVDGELVGKPVELTIAPQEKYAITQDKRILGPLVRVEVYPRGNRPVPDITATLPWGEKVIKTTTLPISPTAKPVEFNAERRSTDAMGVYANTSYIADIRGAQLPVNAVFEIVDKDGQPVPGACAGNEPETCNGRPIEVGAYGGFLKVYFQVESTEVGRELFWRIGTKDHNLAQSPITVSADTSFQEKKPPS